MMAYAFCSKPGRAALAAALLVLIGGCVVAVSMASAGKATSSLADPVANVNTAKRIAPQRYFSVLRRAHASVAISAEQANELARTTGDPSTIKRLYAPDAAAAIPLGVKTLSSSRHAYAIPGTGALCLYVPDSTGFGPITCEATQLAQRGYVIDVEYGSLSSDDATVVGLAPNGVTSVTGIASDGSSVQAPVVGNAYELQLNHLRSLQIGSNELTIPAPLGPPPTNGSGSAR